MNRSKAFGGGLILGLGVLLLLDNLGFFSLSLLESASLLWPVGLILAGIALLLRLRGTAALFILLTLGVGLLSLHERVSPTPEERHLIQAVEANPALSAADIHIGFGGGALSLARGSPEFLVQNYVVTHNRRDPTVQRYQNGSTGIVRFDRQGLNPATWRLNVSPAIPVSLDLDYGAASVMLDLRGLMVPRLDADSGASDTAIYFDAYPTAASIHTGASGLTLVFPKEYGVTLGISGGAVATDFRGFAKQGKRYTNAAYVDGGQNIVVDIEAGATSIKVITQ